MKVIVFGASGATGRELVKQAIAQGYSVTVFVRNPAKFAIEHPGISIQQGDVADRVAVERAIRGQDEVICTLGGSSLLKRNPALVAGIHNLVLSMEQASVQRLIYLSNDAVTQIRRILTIEKRSRGPSEAGEKVVVLLRASQHSWCNKARNASIVTKRKNRL
jgi:putative NADH-flavin reductase